MLYNLRVVERKILKQFLEEWPASQSFSRTAEILAFQKFKLKKPILDLACGDGLFGEVLFGSKKGAVKVGIDINPREAEKAAKRRVYQQVKVADAAKLPFLDQTFATVFSNSSLEHMLNLDQVLAEISRVLKIKGRLVFLVPSQYLADFFLTGRLTVKIRNRLFGHFHLFGPKRWAKKLQQKGLQMKEYHYVGGEKNWLVVELLLPFWLIGAFLNKLIGRWTLPPRKPIIFLVATFFGRFLPSKPFCAKGPGLLIMAEKEK